MTRWETGSRQRLSEAAMHLFAQQGYAATTVDDVASAAGVTQRTFFRHFHDKEEVVFADDDRLLEILLQGVRAARADDAAGSLRGALYAIASELEPLRGSMRVRARIIVTDVALTGRELAKQTRWKDAVADALRAQGYDPQRADLLAHVGFAVFRHAQEGWIADEAGPGLMARVDQALAELAEVFSGRA